MPIDLPSPPGGSPAPAPKPIYSLEQIVYQLRASHDPAFTCSWKGSGTIGYILPASPYTGEWVPDPPEAGGAFGLVGGFRLAARAAFALLDDVIAVSIAETSTPDDAQIQVMYSSTTEDDGSGTDHRSADGVLRYASTPLLYDVAALQAMYGADWSTRSGDTVYGFHSTADRSVFDFGINAEPIVCIWDGGGIDTLDLSGYGTRQSISLVAGSFSDVGYMTGNLSIAFGAVIENAVGGSGADLITGNGQDNTITGGAGDDTIDGAGGADAARFGGCARRLFKPRIAAPGWSASSSR